MPFLGECVFFSNGFKLNLELILFWGPWTPWKTYGQLKDDYKRRDKRAQVVDTLRKVSLWFGVINLLLCPLVFIWQLLYSFFNYAELIKRDPAFLGARRWSLFGEFQKTDHIDFISIDPINKSNQFQVDTTFGI